MNYLLNNWYKFVIVAVMIVSYNLIFTWISMQQQFAKAEQSVKQLNDQGQSRSELQNQHFIENNGYVLGLCGVGVLSFLVFLGDLRRLTRSLSVMVLTIFAMTSVGCYRPFEPVKLEVISSNEEAFLLPYTGDSKKQTSSNSEEYLKENLVYTKQVQIPQQWVRTGYETWGPKGKWEDAAAIIKVDKSPVTREWSVESTRGTSEKDEGIWVMTSDQVEFSTGWVCTARISSRDDAVKFLHNYPNGSLTKVMDTEIRSKLQTEFGLEVTDLPMESLRKAATPHIVTVVNKVKEFFRNRGIEITNLGISGGFVYKDKTILTTLVKVFNAEQEKAIAAAETSAQEERNKKVILESSGKADALLKTKKAEAEGIRAIADAKLYEMDKAQAKMQDYVQLKQIELQKELLQKWDGSYPQFFSGNNSPNMLLQLPGIDSEKKSK